MSEILKFKRNFNFYRLAKSFVSHLWNMPVFSLSYASTSYNEGQGPVQMH